MILSLIIIVIIIFLVGLGISNYRYRQDQLIFFKESFGSKPDIEDWNSTINNFHELKEKSSRLIDDITANDLELNQVFMRLNTTQSFVGEQVLYHRLHCLMDDPEELSRMEKRLCYFIENEDYRATLQVELSKIGKNPRDYYLPHFLFNASSLVIKKMTVYYCLQIFLIASFILALIFQHPLLYLLTMSSGAINLLVYLSQKSNHEINMQSLDSIRSLIHLAKKLANDGHAKENLNSVLLNEPLQLLKKLDSFISNFQFKKGGSLTGDVWDLMKDYAVGITLWDFVAYRKIMLFIQDKLDSLLIIYDFIGQLDAEISIASFRKSLPFYSIPHFTSESVIQMDELYHPLIDHPISNSFTLDKGCILTGSNASGKSTFIKAFAINAILSQTIHTSLSKNTVMPFCHVMTSMAIKDDLMAKQSYYLTELTYLKRILTQLDKKELTLCIFDEILRGTNTTERLATASSVLKYLMKQPCFAVVATHDLELAYALQEKYACYNFHSTLIQDEVKFDYQLYHGIDHHQNAIQLLKSLKFKTEIIETAQSDYQYFSTLKN